MGMERGIATIMVHILTKHRRNMMSAKLEITEALRNHDFEVINNLHKNSDCGIAEDVVRDLKRKSEKLKKRQRYKKSTRSL